MHALVFFCINQHMTYETTSSELSYRRATLRCTMLVSWCYVSGCMAVRKASNNQSWFSRSFKGINGAIQ